MFCRYRDRKNNVDGLPGTEGVFLLCTFWLADCLHLIGRTEDARELFERLLALRNDVGLLSEQYDPRAKRQLGNFPAGVFACRAGEHGANPLESADGESSRSI